MERDTFMEWVEKFHKTTSSQRFLFNEEITQYIAMIYLYNQTLERLTVNVPDDQFWQIGVALHGDITYMYSQLSILLQDYLNEGVFDLDSQKINSYKRPSELSEDFAIIKHWDDILKLSEKAD